MARRSHHGSARRAFTLIELLVVIAIIGILAAMLFPVFARARESARKTQCLASVKNIAMAYQIYLTDFDAFPPSGKHDTQMMKWLDDNCGGCRTDCAPTVVNPYLRIPVILDEYTKSRDIWKCPSAKFSSNSVAGVEINAGIPNWFQYFLDHQDGCPRMKLCNTVFPPGWGGSVTDTGLQGTCGFEGAFDQSIGTPYWTRDVKTSTMRDVAKTVVCGDSGTDLEGQRTSAFAYPDQSRMNFIAYACGAGESGNCTSDADGCGNAGVASQCSQLSVCYGGDGKFSTDASYRRKFARHMGGSNLGFADGHAKWMDAEAILFGGQDMSHYGIHPQLLYGLQTCFNPTNKSRWEKAETDDPTAGLF